MKKIIVLSSVLLGVVFFAGCGQQQADNTQSTASAPITNHPAGNQAQPSQSLKSVSQCKDNLDSLSTKDKDTCYGINANETNDASLCDKIANVPRKDLCYMRIARASDNDQMCRNIMGAITKSACIIYAKDMNPAGDVEKGIKLSQADNKIKQNIDDIETRFIKGDLTEDKLQQEIDNTLDSHKQTAVREKLSIY